MDGDTGGREACEVPKEEQEDCREVDKEIDRDVPYDANTRYYWF